jgi:hypothetical protein
MSSHLALGLSVPRQSSTHLPTLPSNFFQAAHHWKHQDKPPGTHGGIYTARPSIATPDQAPQATQLEPAGMQTNVIASHSKQGAANYPPERSLRMHGICRFPPRSAGCAGGETGSADDHIVFVVPSEPKRKRTDVIATTYLINTTARPPNLIKSHHHCNGALEQINLHTHQSA